MPTEPASEVRTGLQGDSSLSIAISDADLEKIIERRTLAKHPVDSPRWAELAADQRKRYAKGRTKKKLLGKLGFKRSQAAVREIYESSWQDNSALTQVLHDSVDLFEWRGTGYEARYPTTQALHDHLISTVLSAVRPQKVLEVGCGSGLHLFLLASRHPEIELHGAELTETGVREAEAIRVMPELPEEIADFPLLPIDDLTAHQRIRFHQANAADLPFPDDWFDVVYTAIALEQMEEIRDEALASLKRVARDWVVMVEPFRDFNLEGTRRDYVESRDIFGAFVEDLPRYGLDPVLVHADIPCKVSLGVGLVVAKVV